MQHIIWDWNCTLLNDFHAILEGTRLQVLEFGGPHVDAEFYRAHHQRPISAMYESMLGRSITAEEAFLMGEHWNDVYKGLLAGTDLSAGAREALDRVASARATQSLLSMWYQNDLEVLVEEFGISKHFLSIDGITIGRNQVKANHLEGHIERVLAEFGDHIDRRHITMIGDCVDDAHAAAHGGVNCVLYPYGMDSRENLEKTGYPVANSLLEALDIVGV